MRRIRCRWHEEKTASCIVYHDHFRCYGCGKFGPLSELGIASDEAPEPTEPENLEESLAYILSLPHKDVRGLSLRADNAGFYIVWPGLDYYKLRFWAKDAKPKYIGAKGHRKPDFWASRLGQETLIVVEGELNALSIAIACPEFDVVSPGSATDFCKKNNQASLHTYIQYCKICIVADDDAPGAKAVISMYADLVGNNRAVGTLLVSPDCNDILQEEGANGLAGTFSRRVEEALDKCAV